VQELDSIQTSVTNGKVLVLDIMDEINWELETSGDRIELLDCRLTITNSDLQ
jgi:hypothetical protein